MTLLIIHNTGIKAFLYRLRSAFKAQRLQKLTTLTNGIAEGFACQAHCQDTLLTAFLKRGPEIIESFARLFISFVARVICSEFLQAEMLWVVFRTYMMCRTCLSICRCG